MSLRYLLAFALLSIAVPARAELRVGAKVVDVSPPQFPVLVNGGMLNKTAGQINTPVSARAIVVDDGQQRLAIVVVDSCMMPRPLLDDAKRLAAKRTDIQPDHMLISATHTHTAPSCMGALGTDADPAYVSYLREKLAEAIAAAEAELQPARVGFATGDAAPYTALRRWVRRSDRVADDPFGNPTVRANMHSANNWDDVTGPSGPEDPELSLIAFQSPDGQPIAMLANFSMHYFGDRPISADYFGLFANRVQDRLAAEANDKTLQPVAIMSHGCSGDIWRRDYALRPEDRPDFTIDGFTDDLVEIALEAYEDVEYQTDATIAMAEQRLPMKYRVPDKQLLQWAQKIIEPLGDNPPTNTTEVYAREQVRLHQLQATEVVVQALRIGDIGIATTPTETYALTGLKLKLQSPLKHTMVIELANGGDGYIPPPEQHVLGGYNTWAARSAGLEVTAEPKITAAGLALLEQVSGQPRHVPAWPQTSEAKTIASLGPLAHYRMNEFEGPRAIDAGAQHRDGIYESGVVFFLEGAPVQGRETKNVRELNRAAHFAGGRLRTRFEDLGDSYSVAMWFWNGMPNEARETTGWLFSRDHEHTVSPQGDHLGIGGTATKPGCLVYQHGGDSEAVQVGSTPLERWSWNRVLFVRDGQTVRVYLNDNAKPEITAELDPQTASPPAPIFFGGRSDNQSNFEGRIDEVAVFGEALEATSFAE
ncbi:LamG-like jellyroll fold domain-containing protein [Roseimaritima ulvae]|uniref:Neutral/alkaline non-lysosomal ceramidase n=1 Tax=Roseimaritima ulvae TaxID=980254 RepID=A0A5B9QWH0_9BACT|nr:LamG-like jellyroll fold domain-containing protein [Roseimaritima ulvae]QEG43384.1 Neutral/alkaline non-lysosomal ceramidase [Roseimaritima ulvae]